MSNPSFPAIRMRRNRRTDWSRRLTRETILSVDDFIWPIFVIESTNKRQPVPSMPGVERLSIDLAVKAAEEAGFTLKEKIQEDERNAFHFIIK